MKIGILTLFYNNRNYGGLLQAYALQKYFYDLGYECEQIQYKQTKAYNVELSIREKIARNGYAGILYKLKRKMLHIRKKGWNTPSLAEFSKIEKRTNIMDQFRMECIPHSDQVYTSETLFETNDLFDVFVVGSDQVWKPYILSDSFLLNFTEKPKIAYAASMGVNYLYPAEVAKFSPGIKKMNSISVREKNLVNLFSNQFGISARYVVDPVFLIDSKEWEEFAEKSQIKMQGYLFCYFLGGIGLKRQKEIRDYANRNNLKIVFMACQNKNTYGEERNFGDERIYAAGPYEFVNLIKNADLICTDSFHATAFSEIFNKKFVVYNRKEETAMIGRITSLLTLFHHEERLISSLDEINLHDFNCNESRKKFEMLVEASKDFIQKSIIEMKDIKE